MSEQSKELDLDTLMDVLEDYTNDLSTRIAGTDDDRATAGHIVADLGVQGISVLPTDYVLSLRAPAAPVTGSREGADCLALPGLVRGHIKELKELAQQANTHFNGKGSNWDPNVCANAVTLMASQIALLTPNPNFDENTRALLIQYAARAEPKAILALIAALELAAAAPVVESRPGLAGEALACLLESAELIAGSGYPEMSGNIKWAAAALSPPPVASEPAAGQPEPLLRDEVNISFKVEFQEGDTAWYVYQRHTSQERATAHLDSLAKEPHFSNRNWRVVRCETTNKEQVLPAAPLPTPAPAPHVS